MRVALNKDLISKSGRNVTCLAHENSVSWQNLDYLFYKKDFGKAIKQKNFYRGVLRNYVILISEHSKTPPMAAF